MARHEAGTAPAGYATQSAWSDPGDPGARFDELPRGLTELCSLVQGLLLHDHFGGLLYGPPPPRFQEASRATQPVSRRLAAILAADPAPLSGARAPFARSVGTCRDYALLLVGLLRRQGRPARLRCGFADYFHAGFEDHWVCEYWQPEREAWALADPQLDPPTRAHLGIAFDPTDLPAGQFRFSWQAWQACRAGRASPSDYGHGDAKGTWFLQVNLARDLLALVNRETSDWDGWRTALPGGWRSSEDDLQAWDQVAALAAKASGLEPPHVGSLPALGLPPWLADPVG
ncbi:MAG: transglutaminase-like domain-containing protein [Rhodospirillales bacterium]